MPAAEQLPASLFAAPRQEDELRHLASPAERGPIPMDAQWQRDVAVVPVGSENGQLQHLVLPRDQAVEFVLRDRELLLRRGAADPAVLAQEYELCRRSRLWFVARWVDLQTKFPIGKNKALPFVPYPYQVRGIRLYDQARDLACGIFQEKSRQLGESWLFMALFLHGVLFEDQFGALVTHRKMIEVDDGGAGSTTKSLLGRLRFMYERLPPFLRLDPLSGDKETLEIKHLLVRNGGRGSFIVGEGSSPAIGRGAPGYTAWLGDEWAWVDQSESAWASVDEAVETPILNSTPLGEHNHFGRTRALLVEPRSELEAEVRKRFLANRVHWSEHPLYSIGIAHDGDGRLTSPWYRKACATKTPDKAAQEYDISYSTSLPGRYFTEFSQAAHVAPDPIPLRGGLWYYLSADHGLADTEVWGLWQTDGRTFAEMVAEWHTVPPGQQHGVRLTSSEVAQGVSDWLEGFGLSVFSPYMYAIIGDPAGAAQEQTSGQSHHELLRATWRRLAGKEAPPIIPANNDFEAGIESVRLLLRGSLGAEPFALRYSPTCRLTIDSIGNHRRRVTSKGLVLPDEHKDWTNHASDMNRYFIHTVFPAIGDALAEEQTPEAYVAALAGRSWRGR